jgi:hypothetical protein
MCHEQYRTTEQLIEFSEQSKNLSCRFRIEVASRFIGKQQSRARD